MLYLISDIMIDNPSFLKKVGSIALHSILTRTVGICFYYYLLLFEVPFFIYVMQKVKSDFHRGRLTIIQSFHIYNLIDDIIVIKDEACLCWNYLRSKLCHLLLPLFTII